MPLLLTALGYKPHNLCRVPQIDLSRFQGLSGDTVVELVQAVAVRNRRFMTKKQKKDESEPLQPLELLDVSFNYGVTPDHVARILAITPLDELRIWDNPGLAAVSDERIAKLTSRKRFPGAARAASGPARGVAVPGTHPARAAHGADGAHSPAGVDDTQDGVALRRSAAARRGRLDAAPPPGSVSLAKIAADKLAWILHPRFRGE